MNVKIFSTQCQNSSVEATQELQRQLSKWIKEEHGGHPIKDARLTLLCRDRKVEGALTVIW